MDPISDNTPLIKAPPLIKWPGGKRALLGNLIPLLSSSTGTYFEPFVGGGALFFATQPIRAVLSDTNNELINLYHQIRDYPKELCDTLVSFKNSESDYYRIRDSSPRTPLRRAARFFYLTTLSFNGIHRVNLRGHFNVPYGYKTHLPVVDKEKVFAASKALSAASLLVADFEVATEFAKKGDVIYFDPPYTVAHGHNGFVKYNEKIFSWHDQVRLADHARQLVRRGCKVIISNADHSSVCALYDGFNRKTITRFSIIAASGEHRRIIREKVFYLGGRA